MFIRFVQKNIAFGIELWYHLLKWFSKPVSLKIKIDFDIENRQY